MVQYLLSTYTMAIAITIILYLSKICIHVCINIARGLYRVVYVDVRSVEQSTRMVSVPCVGAEE